MQCSSSHREFKYTRRKDVLEHYDRNFKLGLTDPEKGELIEYLKSL